MRDPGRAGLLVALLCAATAGACAPGDADRVVVERDSPATRGEALAESIGIETEQGRFTPILEAGCALPCEETVTFGTWEPEQPEILIYLYRGRGDETANAHALGTWELSGYPLSAADDVEIAVTFRADREGITLSATDPPGHDVTLRRSEADGS